MATQSLFPRRFRGNEAFGVVDNVVGQIRTLTLADGTVDDLTVNQLSLGEQMNKGVIKKITGYLPRGGLAKRGFAAPYPVGSVAGAATDYTVDTLGNLAAAVPTFSYLNSAPDLPESTPSSFENVLRIPKGNQIISVKVTNNGKKIPADPFLRAELEKSIAGQGAGGDPVPIPGAPTVSYPPIEAAVLADEATDATTGAFLLGLSVEPPSVPLGLNLAYGLIDPQGGIVGTLLGISVSLEAGVLGQNDGVQPQFTFCGNKADLNQVNGIELYRSCPDPNNPMTLPPAFGVPNPNCLFGFTGKVVSAPGKRWSTKQQARIFEPASTFGLQFGAAPKYLNEDKPEDFAYLSFHNGSGGGSLRPVVQLLEYSGYTISGATNEAIAEKMNTVSIRGDVAVEVTYYDTSATPQIPL